MIPTAPDHHRVAWQTRLMLTAAPPLAAGTVWFSPVPGSANQVYAYRVLVALLVPAALSLLITAGRRRAPVETALAVMTVLLAAWGCLALSWTLDEAAGLRQVVGCAIATVGAVGVVGAARGSQEGVACLRDRKSVV